MRKLLGLSVLLLLSACGSSPATDDAASGVDAANEVDAAVPVDAADPIDAYRGDTNVPTTVTTGSIGPFSVERGHEQTLCVVIRLDNDAPAFIRGIRTHLTPGSHHLIVSDATGRGESGPSPCPAFASGVTNAIFIAQQAEAELYYPGDSGLPIAAHQEIGLEMHMINYFSDTPVDIAGSVDFDIASGDLALRPVHILFTGTLSLNLPPHEVTTVTDDFTIAPGTEIFALTSHTHQLGTYASLEIVSGSGAELVHESRSWSDPPLDVFSPPRVFGSGESLRLTCTYMNDTDDTVHFGESFNDEMCFLWAYYLDPR